MWPKLHPSFDISPEKLMCRIGSVLDSQDLQLEKQLNAIAPSQLWGSMASFLYFRNRISTMIICVCL